MIASPDPATPPLPAALRLPPHRSVFPHGPRSRLLGLDPAVALAVDDLPPPLAAMLDELTAAVPTAQLVERAVDRGADPTTAHQLLRELLAAGAVADAAVAERQADRRGHSTVVVRGAGPLTVGVALGLAQAQIAAVHVVTSGSVRTADLGTGLVEADLGRDRARATSEALGRLCPGVTGGGPPPQRVVPDLVVLADAILPDPVQLAELHATGTAHLPVRLRDGVGVVGPLVLPGRTTCLGCLEMQRCAADPAWPTVAARLVGVPGHGDPACVVATAGLATAQALRWLDGPDGATGPPTLDATLELDTGAGTLVRREWGPQPGCACGAAHGGTGHGAAACADGVARDTIDE